MVAGSARCTVLDPIFQWLPIKHIGLTLISIIGRFGNSSPTATPDARFPEEKAWLGTTVNYVK
jgi:hypothetical protein